MTWSANQTGWKKYGFYLVATCVAASQYIPVSFMKTVNINLTHLNTLQFWTALVVSLHNLTYYIFTVKTWFGLFTIILTIFSSLKSNYHIWDTHIPASNLMTLVSMVLYSDMAVVVSNYYHYVFFYWQV